jgi:flagellar motor switch/type III secretory pathway protein FliN
MADPDPSLENLVAEAPVVVRLELCTVSLNAGEVAALRPGDVIETGSRLGQPVVLRVAGRAIARGDLVDVEGELGVRIRELLETER